jgi:prolyl oligopeptidase
MLDRANHYLAAALLVAIFPGLCTAADDQPAIPATPRKPVTDEYHGVQIVDDYRWLEPHASAEARQWSDQQNARTRAYLDHLSMRPALVDSLNRLEKTASVRFSSMTFRGGILFAIETQPPKLQPFLATLASVDNPGSARAVVDPNTIDPSGSTSIDFYVPSIDGKLVAVSLSKGGSEEGSVSVFEVATGKQLPEVIARVNGATAGGSVAWNASPRHSGFRGSLRARKGVSKNRRNRPPILR